MKKRVGIFTASESLKNLLLVQEEMSGRCEVSYHPYSSMAELTELYSEHAKKYDGILFSGRLPYDYVKQNLVRAEVPHHYMEMKDRDVYLLVARLLAQNPNLDFNRVYFDTPNLEPGDARLFKHIQEVFTKEHMPNVQIMFDRSLYHKDLDSVYHRVMERYRETWRNGELEVAVTRVSNLAKWLESEQIPHVLFQPCPATMMEVFLNLLHDIEIAQMEKSLTACCVIRIKKEYPTERDYTVLKDCLEQFNSEQNMLLGILVINRAAEKGQLEKLGTGGKVGQIPKHMQIGMNLDIAKQPSMGRDIGQSSCIDTVSIHMALIFMGCALAYYFRTFMMGCPIPFLANSFKNIPVWFVALLMMYIVNYALKLLKLNWMVDKKVKSRCTGFLSDFAITAAVASCNVKAVMTFIVPIIVMCIVGFILTYIGVFTFNKWLFKGDYPIERSVICWGTNTGVMITGMMLLKIADPDYETPALNEFAGGFALMSIISIFTSPITYGLIGNQATSTLTLLGFNALLSAGYFALAIVGKLLYEARKKSAA